MDNLEGEMHQDGSLDSAVANMPDITADDPVQPASRGEDGRFAGKAGKADNEADNSADKEPDDEPEDVSAEADQDDDEDYIELDPEEGGEPVRLSLSELLEARTKAQELEQQIAEAKKAQPLPSDIEQALQQTISERSKYVQALQQWAAYNQPREPDAALLNPQNPNYDPEQYFQQKQAFDSTWQQQQQVQQEIENLNAQHQQEQQALQQSRMVREREALLKVWPEATNPEVAKAFREDVASIFGIDQETLNTIHDHRFYAIARDAIAHRKASAAKKEAVKAVRAKPKLIRGKARSPSSPKQAQQQAAMTRLQSSGRVEDAADLMGKFL